MVAFHLPCLLLSCHRSSIYHLNKHADKVGMNLLIFMTFLQSYYTFKNGHISQHYFPTPLWFRYWLQIRNEETFIHDYHLCMYQLWGNTNMKDKIQAHLLSPAITDFLSCRRYLNFVCHYVASIIFASIHFSHRLPTSRLASSFSALTSALNLHEPHWKTNLLISPYSQVYWSPHSFTYCPTQLLLGHTDSLWSASSSNPLPVLFFYYAELQ